MVENGLAIDEIDVALDLERLLVGENRELGFSDRDEFHRRLLDTVDPVVLAAADDVRYSIRGGQSPGDAGHLVRGDSGLAAWELNLQWVTVGCDGHGTHVSERDPPGKCRRSHATDEHLRRNVEQGVRACCIDRILNLFLDLRRCGLP